MCTYKITYEDIHHEKFVVYILASHEIEAQKILQKAYPDSTRIINIE